MTGREIISRIKSVETIGELSDIAGELMSNEYNYEKGVFKEAWAAINVKQKQLFDCLASEQAIFM